MTCAICGGSDGSTFRVREMMFGTREGFEYFLCDVCGCCQLMGSVEPERHYPREYHAFQPQPRPTGMRGPLRRWRNKGVFLGSFPGRLLEKFKPYPVYGAGAWFTRMGARRHMRILDVGCGAGELVHDLVEAGFSLTEGIDPLVPEDALRRLPGRLHKRWLHEASGEYDLVMLHHVLEHMPDQRDVLRHVARLLRAGAWCLIRVPVVPNEAWERYRENWVQFDAPRHLFIHSERSLAGIASDAGLRLEHVEYDSTEFQFAGSELYERDIALGALSSTYTRSELRRFRCQARRLNRARRGDQAAFYFRKLNG